MMAAPLIGFGIGALITALTAIVTRIIAFFVIKLTIRLFISAIVWAMYIAFFVFAADLIHSVYDALNQAITSLQNNYQYLKLASATGILPALIDVVKIDLGFMFLLLQYKLFVFLRNLYTRGANEVDKTISSV